MHVKVGHREVPGFTGTLCYAIVLSGRKSSFRAGFGPDSSRESIKNPPGILKKPRIRFVMIAVGFQSIPPLGLGLGRGRGQRKRGGNKNVRRSSAALGPPVAGPTASKLNKIKIDAWFAFQGVHFILRNSASGSEIGFPVRISAGIELGKLQNHFSGRPKAGRRDRPSRLESDRDPAWKLDVRPRGTISIAQSIL